VEWVPGYRLDFKLETVGPASPGEDDMPIETYSVEFRDIAAMRDIYRQEMSCQIIHDSIHSRPGWTQEYLFREGGAPLGYGSVAVSGPWKEKPTVYEFFVLPQYRTRLFDLFSGLLKTSGATLIETQSNDSLLTVMLHTFAQNVTSESILFQDKLTTLHAPSGAIFRRANPEDVAQIAQQQLDAEAKWLVIVGGIIAAAGDILFHYNRPYGDIYMKVSEPFRRHGYGAYLVQELKRVCYEGGSVPAARCNPNNIASRKTLQKAGFVPCGHILNGSGLL
jgi:GNAT superfamily N-acetyltransferase